MFHGLRFEKPVISGLLLVVGMILVYLVFSILWMDKQDSSPLFVWIGQGEIAEGSIAPDTITVETCEGAHNGQMKDECVCGLAQRDMDSNLCLKIQNRSLEIRCVTGIALQKNDSAVCRVLGEGTANCSRIFANMTSQVMGCFPLGEGGEEICFTGDGYEIKN